MDLKATLVTDNCILDYSILHVIVILEFTTM